MEDRFGHRISYLRISITDRCNERCLYCLPEETQQWLPRDGILSYEEIIRIILIGTELGIRKLRITGGEPLTRRGVIEFLTMIRDHVPLVTETGLSTNGTLLATPPPGEAPGSPNMASRIVQIGVRTVNISLDTLDAATYASITSRDYYQRAVDGIRAAVAAGFSQVKLNCVLMKGRTESELPALIDFARDHRSLLRFIELMPVSTREVLTEENFLSCGVAKNIIESHYGRLIPCPDMKTNGPASYYQIPGRDQHIGFIGAMTNFHFCEGCNKLRLTADGKLRPCLGSHLETDLITPLRAGASDADLRQLILDTVDRKPKEHDFRENYQPDRRMIAIGG